MSNSSFQTNQSARSFFDWWAAIIFFEFVSENKYHNFWSLLDLFMDQSDIFRALNHSFLLL